MRRFLPILLSAASALAVALVVTSIDSRYEATASARVQVLFETEELDTLLRIGGLPELDGSTETPFLPGEASLAEVETRTSRRLGGAPFEPGDVRTIDTLAQLVTPELNDPERRLKMKAVAENPERAARLANVYLAEYIRELDRSTARVLLEARERFRKGSRPTLSRISAAGRAELVEAADVAIALHGGVLTDRVAPASAPSDPISPNPVRDIVVAAFIGALLGWLFPYALSAASRSKSSRLRSTMASRL